MAKGTDRRPPLPSGPYVVVGLARSGQAAARALVRRGERVIGLDSGRPEGAEGLGGEGVELVLDGDGLEKLAGAGCVVKSPGVPAEAPVIAAARERGVPVIGELELGWRMLANRFCAVTGTNGKTTVVEMIGHVLRTAGEPVAVAGNVGRPVAGLVGRIEPDVTVVCEASSFQLEDTAAFAPECGVLLNVTPDHLDRHGTFAAYLAAKLRIFANQGNDDVCVYNGSDPALADVDLGGCGRRIAFCAQPGETDDCQATLAGDVLELWGEPLLELDDLPLPGPHNAANAAAVAAAAGSLGTDREAVAEGLRTFAGVPHRLEQVASVDGVLYVNDSKATNVAAAAAALRSFDSGVHAIVGGSLKGGDFAGLIEPVTERCRGCYLIGEAAERIERDLRPAWEAGVAHRRCDDLDDAVRRAAAAARSGEVVLLAPACASFDSFRDFEQRGERFRAAVGELP